MFFIRYLRGIGWIIALVLISGCIQAQEGGVNTPEEVVRNNGPFDQVETFETYTLSDDITLVFLRETNKEERIWVGSTTFNEEKNEWIFGTVVNLRKPTDDMADVKTMFESGDGYSVGYVKGDTEQLGDVEHIVELDNYQGWKIWVKGSSSF
ncbi:hypothetical protein [Halobacillus salinus]|uniref:hypothetical protein n=1 Tax=Halobacillus salinus TaxID=192814 RepID=UPI0009A88F4B|nr:hypothetical protein [Halobacillus salinus]